MSIRNRLGRRWRSVTFKAGLWSAVWVGLLGLVVSVMYSIVILAPGNTIAFDGLYHTMVLDQIERQVNNGVEPDDLAVSMYHVDGPADPTWTFWAVLDSDAVVGSAGSVSSDVLGGPYVDIVTYPADRAFPRTVKQHVGTQWYVVERDIATNDGRQLRAVAAIEDITDLRFQVENDLKLTAPVVLVLMLGALLLTSFFTRRSLRRVETMRSAVEAITEESLDQRVPLTNAADNIDKLAATMNDMLERLERSADQQNQFLADASHELRSPVAGLVAQLEVAAAYPDRVEQAVLLPKLEAEAQRLQALVNDLLFLSRSEAGESRGLASAFEHYASIDDVIDAEVAHQHVVGAGIDLVIAHRSGDSVAGNRRDLERAIRNLVDNAVRHSDTTVQIGSRRDGTNVVVSVVDDGPGVPADDADRIFDRFVRLDEARSRDDGGAGLGLAIARQIARKYGGDVSLVVADQGAHFELKLPATAASS